MKRKIVNCRTKSEIIDVSKIVCNDYIGIEIISHEPRSQKGFVTRTNYDSSGKYTIRCLDAVTSGNGWDTWDEKDYDELFGWL